MIRKKSIMAAALAAVLACQTFPAFGGAAPDGKTLAQDTEAAQEALTMRGRNGGRS